MTLFKALENNRPFIKMAFEGFAGDGKTFTATQVAIGIHKLIGSTKPIALFDTERAFKALKKEFEDAGIKAVVNDEERSLAAVNQAIKWCEEGNADILIIDSITHVWEEFLRAYMQQKNRSRLEFQDWGIIKPKWKQEFSTPFVLAKCHIIFTGRAGYEYSDERNEDGKREIFKSGIKMKAENETAFEPDILVLMQKQQDLISEKKTIWREATIVKDRTTQIDGKTFRNPTFDDFYPAISQLLDGKFEEVHGQRIPDTFEEFENKFGKQAKDRELLIAEINGAFEIMGVSGTGAKDKQLRAWSLNKIFGVNSIDMLSRVSLERIKEGKEILKNYAGQYADYLSNCLDSGIEVDSKQVAEIMKGVLTSNPKSE